MYKKINNVIAGWNAQATANLDNNLIFIVLVWSSWSVLDWVITAGSATNKHNSKRKAQINKSWNTIKRMLPVIIYRLVSLLA
jgi:hypothetical protein